MHIIHLVSQPRRYSVYGCGQSMFINSTTRGRFVVLAFKGPSADETGADLHLLGSPLVELHSYRVATRTKCRVAFDYSVCFKKNSCLTVI